MDQQQLQIESWPTAIKSLRTVLEWTIQDEGYASPMRRDRQTSREKSEDSEEERNELEFIESEAAETVTALIELLLIPLGLDLHIEAGF